MARLLTGMILLLGISIAMPLRASEYFREQKLKISWDDSVVPENAPPQFVEKACRGFAKYLMNDSGLWGTGPFSSFVCEKKKTDAAASFDINKRNAPDWLLFVQKKDKGEILFTLTYVAGKKPIIVVEFPVSNEVQPVTYFVDQDIARLVALRLSLSMPFFAIKNPTWLKMDAKHIVKTDMVSDIPPPEKLVVFAASESGGLFRTKVFEELKLVKAERNLAQSVIDQAKSIVTAPEPARWDVVGTYLKERYNSRDLVDEYKLHENPRVLFLKCECDQSIYFGRIYQKIANAVKAAAPPIKPNRPFGKLADFGARYGVPLDRKDSPIANVGFISTFVEMHSGPLNTLRVIYDTIQGNAISTDNETRRPRACRLVKSSVWS